MSATAKVFMSGRSQTLRLPARLRLTAKQVRIEQIGTDWWLHPKIPLGHDMSRWLQPYYTNSVQLPDDFLSDRQDPIAQVRDWT